MTPELGAEWVAYVGGRAVGEVRALFSDEQLEKLGRWLASNKLINPPKHRPEKWIEFECECGCGEVVGAWYRTTRPRFKNEAHRQRYWRRKQRKQA